MYVHILNLEGRAQGKGGNLEEGQGRAHRQLNCIKKQLIIIIKKNIVLQGPDHVYLSFTVSREAQCFLNAMRS